jgi:hypothetical protein
MSITRSLCCSLLLLLPSVAAHAKTLVVDREVPPLVSVAGTSFAADPTLHRAWLVVDFLEHGGEEEQVYSQTVPVDGLTYDAATRTIRLQDGEREVTCAVGKKLLWATYFRATSACPVRVQQSLEKKADGIGPVVKAHFVIAVGPS